MADPLVALSIGLLVLAALVALVWPGRGPLTRALAALRKSERVLLEDALKHVYEEAYSGRGATLNSLAGALDLRQSRTASLIARLEAMGLTSAADEQLTLTAEGRSNALRVIRIHRLWERYLADHSGVPQTEWHDRAEKLEHRTSAEEAADLAHRLGYPRFDPHGDPIPTASGEITPRRGQPLSALKSGERARVEHVEDEPATVYAQLVAEGVEPGMMVVVLDVTPQRIRVEVDGDEKVLAPVVARNVSVTPWVEAEMPVPAGERLSALTPGERGKVAGIARNCFGPQRRRLLDLGLVPGTEVEAELTSPSGDPTAYRIRGASIALRRDQADLVYIERAGA